MVDDAHQRQFGHYTQAKETGGQGKRWKGTSTILALSESQDIQRWYIHAEVFIQQWIDNSYNDDDDDITDQIWSTHQDF